MLLIDVAKGIKRELDIIREYYYDYKIYRRYHYNKKKVKNKNSLEGKITRQAHMLEKGMSLRNPRNGFGVEKAKELGKFIKEYQAYIFNLDESTVVKNAISIMEAYINFHLERGFVPKQVMDIYAEIVGDFYQSEKKGGIVKTSRKSVSDLAKGDFEGFFKSRHSVRQFSEEKVRINDLRKAVNLAINAPSACNRQPCKVYFYQEKEINSKLGELIAGNTGFENEVKNYLVVTSDISAFHDAFERNQLYIDGGIFTLALVEALHFYGIASCILQNGEIKKKERLFREICKNIPENEKIVVFVAIGYYQEEFVYAASPRKEIDDVFIIKE